MTSQYHWSNGFKVSSRDSRTMMGCGVLKCRVYWAVRVLYFKLKYWFLIVFRCQDFYVQIIM